ncbi:lysozyme G-like isoform X3 [Thunnus maccoyii]|uniref:lysozyme G-like isoform X3 n=1 Tax=Thunnus maccoyii TaxID=8240 RepID=UPI001C4D218C|nr:lysozyme G-like isoform X3 [Thunnus maccoyii]
MSREAAEDLRYINQYKNKIIRAANNYGMKPSVVAGIISRETRGGRGAGFVNGWGDNGNAFGLMQVDKNWHTPRGAWDSQEHIDQGTEILADCYRTVGREFPQLTGTMKLRGALAAYNMGTQRMDPNNVDAHTTWGNYSSDVLARAQYYERNGY